MEPCGRATGALRRQRQEEPPISEANILNTGSSRLGGLQGMRKAAKGSKDSLVAQEIGRKEMNITQQWSPAWPPRGPKFNP